MSDLKSSQKRVSLSSEFVGEFFSAIKCFFILLELDLFSNVYVEERESQHAPCILHPDKLVLNGPIMHSMLDVQFGLL